MDQRSTFSKGAQGLITMAAFMIVVVGMKQAEALLVPFLFSVFLAIICAPPFFWLQRKGLPKTLALIIVLVVIIAAQLLVVSIISTSINAFTGDLPAYRLRLEHLSANVTTWLNDNGIPARDLTREYFNPGAVMQLFADMLSGVGGVLSNAFLILLTVVFIMLEASGFARKLQVMSGRRRATFPRLEMVLKNVQRYIAIKTLTSLSTGALIAGLLTVIGVDYPLLWGLIGFLLNYVPNIGSAVAAVPATLLALIQLGTGSMVLTLIGYLAINIVVGSLIEPRLMGRGLGLSTLVVFVSLVFWGWVLGPIGMLLSVPLTMTARIALDSKRETRWIAVLLGPGNVDWVEEGDGTMATRTKAPVVQGLEAIRQETPSREA